MYFFLATSFSFSSTTAPMVVDVSGYQQISVHAWVKGGPGTVSLEAYFNDLMAYSDTLTIGAAGSAMIARTYPVHAPKLTMVLANPSTPMELQLRLYVACCETSGGKISKLLGRKRAGDGEAYRILNERVDIDALRNSHRAEAGA